MKYDIKYYTNNICTNNKWVCVLLISSPKQNVDIKPDQSLQ